ncbi:helix-turn-helix transcriptional regulator [Nonomuraea longicatena]|uniref:HTH cro/C1-type domain-containing protein n=1 Tax=Nonomuraea longicatena TaxID=83682 RepID=A0ABN1Q733_9ACTN
MREQQMGVPSSAPGSRAQRVALREEMESLGCSRASIAEEMRVRWGMRAREAWRHAHGWTMEQLADRINAPAARPGDAVAADASLVSKWEKWPHAGGRRPTPRVLGILAEVFGCAASDLLDLADFRELPDGEARSVIGPPPTAQPVVDRRLPEEGGADSTKLVHHAADESAAWVVWAESSNVGDIALEQLVADVRALSGSYLTGDPLTIFKQVCAQRDRVFRLLEGRQYPRQSTDLYTVAGYLCTLLAWISSDLGQSRAAETQGRTAWLCAELAGHNELRAWALSTRSKVAFWDGRLRDAIGFARRGAEYGSPGTVPVLLALQEADAWSTLGAAQEARAALDRATDARDSIVGIDGIGGLFTCTGFRQANYNAAVLARIGDVAASLREAEAALADRHAQAYGTVAQVQISQGFAHLALGQPDGALDALRPVLALPPEKRLETVTRRARELALGLARSPLADSGPGRSLQAKIEEWRLSALPHTLCVDEGRS